MQELHVRLRMEDGALWATVDEYPGVFASGATPTELRESLEEGIALCLAEPGGAPPRVTLSSLRVGAIPTSASVTVAPK